MHSSGYIFVYGGCLYVGGRLWYDQDNGGVLTYNSGRTSRWTIGQDEQNQWVKMWFVLQHSKAFLCNMAINHWGERPQVEYLEAHDVVRSGQLFGDAWLTRSLINARTDNRINFPRSNGFQFYDTWSAAILTNVTFRNYGLDPAFDGADPAQNYENNAVLLGMTHSDHFKPQVRVILLALSMAKLMLVMSVATDSR